MSEKIMAKHPESNTWEIATIVVNPDEPNVPNVKFGDGRSFEANAVVIGGKVAQAADSLQPPAESAAQPATIVKETTPSSPIAPAGVPWDPQRFKKTLLRLETESQRLFGLPLDVLLSMIMRHATNNELPSAGHMRIFAGAAQFEPDFMTLSAWIDAYFEEIERRKAQTGDPEA